MGIVSWRLTVSTRTFLLIVACMCVALCLAIAYILHARKIEISVSELQAVGVDVVSGPYIPLAEPATADVWTARIGKLPAGHGPKGLIKHLKVFPILDLVVENRHVTLEDVEQLSALENIRSLAFLNTDVTDEVMRPVSGITGLRVFAVSGAKVTDTGIVEVLRHLPNLELVFLSNTAASRAGLASLKTSLPACHIELDNREVKSAAEYNQK